MFFAATKQQCSSAADEGGCTHAGAEQKPILDATRSLSPPQARSFYVASLVAGLRNDVTDEVLSMRQRWRLADIRLEEYSFVVLSRIIGQLEDQVGTLRARRVQGPVPPTWDWAQGCELLMAHGNYQQGAHVVIPAAAACATVLALCLAPVST